LDKRFDLAGRLEPLSPNRISAAELESGAPEARPESREAKTGVQIAEMRTKEARAALLPEAFIRAGFEADRQRFVDRGGANWLVAAGIRWNLFSGFSDRARIAEASAEAASRRSMAKYVASATQVETRRALLELRAADQRLAVATDSIVMAEEALRIIQNRYQGGLADVTQLLRGETALADARVRRIDAIRDQRLAMLAVELAAGTLSNDPKAIQ
jgi:outer membrane protein TolC